MKKLLAFCLIIPLTGCIEIGLGDKIGQVVKMSEEGVFVQHGKAK